MNYNHIVGKFGNKSMDGMFLKVSRLFESALDKRLQSAGIKWLSWLFGVWHSLTEMHTGMLFEIETNRDNQL